MLILQSGILSRDGLPSLESTEIKSKPQEWVVKPAISQIPEIQSFQFFIAN
jgi:hypothetical protein